MFTAQFVHFPGVAASRPHAVQDGLFAAGSRLESCDDLRSHHGGRDVRRESAWIQARPQGYQLSGIARPESGVGRASVPEVDVSEKRKSPSRTSSEMRRI